MEDKNFKLLRWQDWTIFALRCTFIAAASLTTYIWRSQQNIEPIFDDLLLPTGVAIGITVILGIGALVAQLKQAMPVLVLVGDWVIIGAYLYVLEAQPTLTIVLASTLLVSGLLYLGPIWGAFHSLGVLSILAGMVVYFQDTSDFGIILETYAVPLLSILGASISAFIYTAARERFDYSNKTELSRMADLRTEQLREIQERNSNIAKMTDALTGTLNFEKILNAALNIGQISARKKNSDRIVAAALLFREDERLYIADHIGLTFVDTNRSYSGGNGIISQALDEATPINSQAPSKDSDLIELGLKNFRSVLCIPLRAHYDNYGVLIFASEEPNAFELDHVYTLNAIAMQATVALQNAVLYNNLMADKERIIQMEEDARKSLVRDLHDVPTQTISAVVMRLGIVRRMMEKGSPDIPKEINEIEEIARRATEEIRHVLFKLRPLALESQGLGAALIQLAEKMKKTYHQNVSVKVSPEAEQNLDDNQQGALFYLIEEAVNNARKYAEASLITIQAIRQRDIIAIRIADNGKGFDAQAVEANYDNRGSFGMVNMRERAELLDGSLTLKSAPGQGTVITVLIPIKKTQTSDNKNGGNYGSIPASKIASSARDSIERMRYD